MSGIWVCLLNQMSCYLLWAIIKLHVISRGLNFVFEFQILDLTQWFEYWHRPRIQESKQHNDVSVIVKLVLVLRKIIKAGRTFLC